MNLRNMHMQASRKGVTRIEADTNPRGDMYLFNNGGRFFKTAAEAAFLP
jgi:hypothetical protein